MNLTITGAYISV